MKLFDFLLMVITVQLFYSFGVTLIMHTANPSGIAEFLAPTEQINLSEINNTLGNSLTKQTKIPVVDMGSLIFYSGNLFIDLALNFVTAVPSLISVLIKAVTMVFGVNSMIVSYFITFIYTILSAAYFLGILNFILSLRSGSAGAIA